MLNASATGTIAMDAGGTLTVTGAAVFGDAGSGSILLGTGSTLAIAAGLYEGVQASGKGTLQDIDSSDSFSIGGDWVIGDAGTHTDIIRGGASVSVGAGLRWRAGGAAGR